jgi:hypothetical protein
LIAVLRIGLPMNRDRHLDRAEATLALKSRRAVLVVVAAEETWLAISASVKEVETSRLTAFVPTPRRELGEGESVGRTMYRVFVFDVHLRTFRS